MQQLAPRPSQPARPIPYGLVSLWDMINFSLHSFVLMMIWISEEHERTGRLIVAGGDGQIVDPDKERIIGMFKMCDDVCRKLTAERALSRLGRIFTQFRTKGLTYGELRGEFVALHHAIEDDVETERFYHYRRDRGLLVIQREAAWATVLRAFPSTREDIDAAVDCYALEHPHASIYHCMMILERGLPALAKRVGAKFKKGRPTWKDMTDDIQKRIDSRRAALASPPRGRAPPSTRTAKRERSLLEAAGKAALEFRFFEHAWRNHIAHGRADYDEDDAKRVLEHVRAFMELIATELKLKE